MAIPPFPSQDLAKLVLGYLAEEQLMTVYDEFLMASPYLDALQNEYNRILMKSLESIVAEYWAAKIYVEKCKPFLLRKKLLQFSNLLEVVKYLIGNFDMKNLHPYPNSEKIGIKLQHPLFPTEECEACGKALSECHCSKRINCFYDIKNTVETAPINVVETTSLADLPGNTNMSTKRKHVKVLEKGSVEAAQLLDDSESEDQSTIRCNSYSSELEIDIPSNQNSLVKDHDLPSEPITLRNRSPKDTNESDPELRKELNQQESLVALSGGGQHGMPASFQHFAADVGGESCAKMTIPDSSTSDVNNIAQQSTSTLFTGAQNVESSKINKSSTQYLYKVTNCNRLRTNSATDDSVGQHLQKTDDAQSSKVKIISDVKVSKEIRYDHKVITLPQNATSTPLLAMQRIVINGAYEPLRKHSFTREEILAMPTVILVSAPGLTPTTNYPSARNTSMKTSTSSSVTSSTAAVPALGPLTIDISHSPAPPKTSMPLLANFPTIDHGLVKTIDMKNASVPKDSVVSVVGKSATPTAPPLSRKASSTPRRSSHVRVLDFTTPRRILHETCNDHAGHGQTDAGETANDHDDDGLPAEANPQSSEKNTTTSDDSSLKENKVSSKAAVSKSDWDADLRALISASDMATASTSKTKPHRKKKSTAKKDENAEESKSKKKVTAKTSKTKKNTQSQEEKKINTATDKVEAVVKENIVVKPNINIITEWKNPTPEPEKIENKSADAQADTPELDRLSLQNAIGAKLNISDLLETPYKQALYDIQMETPKFLRPDIACDEPVSDIKITDIPTPRFFDSLPAGFTPKFQATPSYSSRTTDYSSGGSYYKPDDHDFAPHPEDLGLMPVISERISVPEEQHLPENKVEPKKEKGTDRRSRPVRRCTKNVSYYDRNKTIEKADVDPLSADVTANSEAEEKEVDKNETLETTKSDTNIKAKKEPRRKSVVGVKKRKTPVKKVTPKSFMKMKPRRLTPMKDNKKKIPPSSTMKSQEATNKDQSKSVLCKVVPAITKSRRKSSTPRKIQPKVFDSSPSKHSNEDSDCKKESFDKKAPSILDSDNENCPLRWSDDASQDSKPKDRNSSSPAGRGDDEDINKIKEYIENSLKTNASDILSSESRRLHTDLVERGFDIETAKSIERDLLDSSPIKSIAKNINLLAKVIPKKVLENDNKNEQESVKNATSDSSMSTNLQIAQDEEEVEEIERSVYESNDDHIITYTHNEKAEPSKTQPHTLKDNFNMEFCIEDDFAIRLRTTQFTMILDLNSNDDSKEEIYKETVAAVSSIPNFEKLYTPMKAYQNQCKELFDSTLTSLDTPLKAVDTPRKDSAVSEIILEVEQLETDEVKEKFKKRKRVRSESCSDESVSDNKKNRRESRYLPNIQNIDIESVLSKLHGP